MEEHAEGFRRVESVRSAVTRRVVLPEGREPCSRPFLSVHVVHAVNLHPLCPICSANSACRINVYSSNQIERRIAALRVTGIFPMRRMIFGAVLALALGLSGGAIADEQKPAAKPLDVKSTFRNICGFCHENYGRKAAKGPQLMNSERSDEFIFNRIKNGMPGRMAAFGTAFTDDQIHDIIKFIRSLKPDEEPQNPS